MLLIYDSNIHLIRTGDRSVFETRTGTIGDDPHTPDKVSKYSLNYTPMHIYKYKGEK